MNFKTVISAGFAGLLCAQSAFAVDYQSVRALIEKDPKMRRIDELLGRLDPELLGNYLLMHNSSSLQLSTPDSPRVILFSNDASFIMAFNGSADLGGNKRLEMIQFNQKENRFEFYEADFPEKADGAVTFSEKNPEECRSCHRVDLRPNWDAYPFWKDAYGSIDGSDTQRVDMFPETKLFKDFMAGAGQRERYKHLKGLQAQTVNNMSHRNLDFNRAAARLNFRRIVSYLKTTPDYAKYKYAFMGAIKYCHVDKFVPAAVQAGFANKLAFYQTDAKITDERIAKQRNAFIKSSNDTFYRPEIIGNMRYLLEGRRIPMGSWSMVFGEETYNMSTGSTGVEELGQVLSSTETDLKGSCDDLQKKSLAALTDG